MEHRYSPRLSVDAKILIYKSGLPMAVGWLRNVCRNGLFIETEYGNVLPNQLLEIELLGGRGERRPHRRCRGLVAHRSAGGLGLAIDDDCPASCEWVDELLARYRRRHAAFSTLRDSVEAAVTPALCG